MNWMFVAITVVSLFGSLSRFIPNVPWTDVFYFFKKDKKDYLKFSNVFRGNYLLISGLVSLVFSILSFFINFKIDNNFIFLVFFIYVIIAEFILQKKWSNHLKHDKVNSV